MLRYIVFIFLVFLVSISQGQTWVCSDEDSILFDEKIKEIQNLDTSESSSLITEVGKSFIGTPYEERTLEINETETLVINLRGMDCTTYVENVLAFGLLVNKQADGMDAFASVLQNIRYREGELNGYHSRLHYFTDWMADNEAKGLVKNITADLGGTAYSKEIHFMSSHRDLYPGLKNEYSFQSIVVSEKRLSFRTLYFMPVEQIPSIEHLIQDGDVIALTTSIPGLDVTHTGFAVRAENGRIHLMHASTSGQVEISEKPLSDYLKEIKNNTGITIARPL